MIEPNEIKGGYKVIRVDGSELFVESKPTIGKIQASIGCECCDTVTLDRRNEIIMIVDDTGMIDSNPVNEKATALAREVFGQSYPYSIHGDVAICWDGDFA